MLNPVYSYILDIFDCKYVNKVSLLQTIQLNIKHLFAQSAWAVE